MLGTRTLVGAIVALSLLTGCSGGLGGAGAVATPTPADLPTSIDGFARICTTQVGFGDATAYDRSAGLHPVVLLAGSRDGSAFVRSNATLPAGWTITEDDDYADNSELAGVQLVACSEQVSTTPTGETCEFEGDDGEPSTTLELTNTVHELTVYSAASGERIGDPQTLEATGAVCPFVAMIREGQTQYLNDPSDDQYVNALKDLVDP